MIVAELLQPHQPKGAKKLPLDDFIFRPKAERDAIARARFVAQLNAAAVAGERASRRKVRASARRLTKDAT